MHIKLFSFTKTGSWAKQARFPKGGKRKSISNKSENGGLLYLKMKLWFRSFNVCNFDIVETLKLNPFGVLASINAKMPNS